MIKINQECLISSGSDINNSKNSRTVIRNKNHSQNYNLFEEILNNCPNKVIITDKYGRIQYFNKKAHYRLNISHDEIFDINFKKITPYNNIKGFKDLYDLLKAEEESPENRETINNAIHFETEFTTRNGVSYPVKIKAVIIKNCGNTPELQECICIYAKIIAIKKEVEEALLNSEKEKIMILNAIHESLIYYDSDFKIMWANKNPVDSNGLKPEELTGKVCHKLWYNRDTPCENCAVKKAMKYRKPFTEEKINFRNKYIKIQSYPVFDDNGKVIGAVESSLDITERKKAENALKISEMKYKELFSTMTNGFALHELITNENGEPLDYRFLKINKAFENMTGLSAEGIKGKTMLELFPNSDRELINRYARIATTGIPDEFNDYNKYLNRHYHIYSYCPKKGQFVSIFTDITDLIELRKQKKESLEQIEKNLEDLAILNDEIRNPLQAITGYVTLEENEYTDKIMSQIKEIDNLVNRLDKGWLESEKIRDFLVKHYNIG